MIVKKNGFCYNKNMDKTLQVVGNTDSKMQVINKSKFIAMIFDADKTTYQDILKQIKRDHLSSTHICYAYRFCNTDLNNYINGELDIAQGYFDDGEPSGTAGAPILKAIVDSNLVNTLIVVVRYFGGVKLGAAGLIKAYKSSAELVTQGQKTLSLRSCYQLDITYSQYNMLNNFFTNNNVIVYDKSFDNNVCVKIAVEDKKHYDYIISNIGQDCTKYLGEKFV